MNITNDILALSSQSSAQTTQGSIWNDSTQKGVSLYMGGIQQQMSATIYSATATALVANSVTETSIIPTGVGTKTIPANFFAPGKSVRIRGGGIFGTLASPGTLTFKLKLGSTVIASSVLTPPVSGVNNALAIELLLVCRAAGGSGGILPDGRMILANYVGATGSGSRVSADMNNLSAPVTVDTTASQVLDLTATWASASATNTLSVAALVIEVLN